MNGKLMSEPHPFAAECPSCQEERMQFAYARDELVQLLRDGADIEAVCRNCDEAWPLSVEERADLAGALKA
jgi:hypothetical protein